MRPDARDSLTWPVLAALTLALTCGPMIGCASRRKQLHRVAKDWCETIRASQVIPVYPPTADLLPGDMYLVDRPAREQHTEWTENGFLALPFELPRPGRGDLPELSDRYAGDRWSMISGDDATDRRLAPPAAFPSYSFRVSNSGSFDLAVPVQGVPIGLSVVGSNGASGTVTLRDVRTFGYDNLELFERVREYWSVPDRRAFLTELAEASSGAQPYLRVVSRVYSVKSFSVTLNAQRSFGAGTSAGMTDSAPEDTPETVDARLATLNASLREQDQQGLGVSARFVSASDRSVSLIETFEEPLVVGYLGFDLPISPSGRLGAPVPTYHVLSKGVAPDVQWKGTITEWHDRLNTMLDLLVQSGRNEARQEALMSAAVEELGRDAATTYRAARDDDSDPANPLDAYDAAVMKLQEPHEPSGPASERVYREAVEAIERALASERP